MRNTLTGWESKTMLDLAEWDWTLPELPVDSWWFFTVVLVLLVLFIWAVARLTTHTTDDIDPAEIDRQMLSAVSELRSQGELTQEEFRSIKSRLVTKLAPGHTSPQPDETKEVEEVSQNPTVKPIAESDSETQTPDPDDSPSADTETDLSS